VLRHGQRRPRLRRACHGPYLAGHHAGRARRHVPRALGPHHGVPVFRARLRAARQSQDLRLPRSARAGFPPAAVRALLPGGFLRARRQRLEPGKATEIAGYQVTPKLQRHTGDSFGYRFAREGKSLVYTTDSEHKLEDPAETAGFVEFFRDADLVIFDAMYSLLDAVSVKEDWGHSSNIVGVELAQMAGVKHLCMFHHEPAFNDERIQAVLNETVRFEELTRGDKPLRITAAYDGMEIEV
jgi:ribonuclease BN (tRNA processing enzyme)